MSDKLQRAAMDQFDELMHANELHPSVRTMCEQVLVASGGMDMTVGKIAEAIYCTWGLRIDLRKIRAVCREWHVPGDPAARDQRTQRYCIPLESVEMALLRVREESGGA